MDDGAAGAIGVGADGADGFAGARAGAPPFAAASTSDLTMRPCGPEPWISVSSTPDCEATRRARGDAKTRAPSARAGVALACAGASTGATGFAAGIGVTFDSSFAAGAGGAGL